MAGALLPVLLFLPSTLNIESFNYTNCDREVVEGVMWQYVYIVEILTIVSILIYVMVGYASKIIPGQRRTTQNILFAVGTILFLIAFMLGNIVGTFSDDWSIAQYGLLGMPVFLGFMGYLMVRYKIFNLNVIASQALVVTLWFLVGSLVLVAQSTQTKIVASITLILITVFGFILIRSVKREVQQREEIAKLAENLKVANERLKVLDKMKSEFVSIASHQLRSPLTAIRGYASMLAEGSYGKLPAKAQEIFEKIVESSSYMVRSVEDYLNVSRIEAGNMKYEMSDFNLKEAAEKLVDELRPVAIKKGLVLVFRSDCNGSCMVHADIGKTRQIIQNIIDNSIKYTPKGTITVVAHDNPKKGKMYVTIQDTGVGMSKETREEVFNKFIRAKNANQINVTGTGLGLYVAKKMVEEMHGKIWAESEGEGKGSTFHIEFPLLPGNPSGR
jgi:signal transduction histidine kinase